MAQMPNMPTMPTMTTPGLPKMPAMPKMNMPNIRMPKIQKPSMPSLPSMPTIPDGLKTPGKYLSINRPQFPKIDISRSIDSLKNCMPTNYITRRPEPETI